ncbi:uncharacterized protein LOC124279199 [Haliotis rubra]|uniref:uncharacterized protein LOC124279199 n=1 Tax=Haliotis rubra TaxID=36100 RepID=UPI001EE51262|nr:uncharacterized protein LOC124279199 [Haliotis rubra]
MEGVRNWTTLLVVLASVPALCLAQLQVNVFLQPTNIIDNVTETLLVRCYLTGSVADGISAQSIFLNFNKSSSVSTITRASVQGVGNPSLSPDIADRATVEGSINADLATSSYLNLNFNNVSCADVGMYTCKFTYQNGTTMTKETSAQVSGSSLPGRIEVRHDPVKQKYAIGETVTLICSAMVSKPARDWTWQKFEGGSWKPYTNGVSQDTPALVTDCAYYRTTSLVYRVTDEDETKFRCIIGSDISTSMETSINGVVNGGQHLIISPVLVMLSILCAIWQ